MKMLLDGEAELFEKSHPLPIKFATSPGGAAYDRDIYCPDWVRAVYRLPSLRLIETEIYCRSVKLKDQIFLFKKVSSNSN